MASSALPRSSDSASAELKHDHELSAPGEYARLWHPAGSTGIELLHGRYQKFAFSKHFHSVSAIGIVESGVMRSYCEGKTHLAPSGTVILFNPGDVHAPQPGDDHGWSFRMLYLDSGVLDSVADSLETATVPWFTAAFVQNRGLAEELLHLHRTLGSDPFNLQSESLLLSCMAKAAQYSLSDFHPDRVDSSRTKVEAVREYLHSCCTENITLGKLSKIAGMSPFHLLRSFRTQVGIPPHAYLLQARVERARSLLQEGLPIAEVALQTGFVDQSHLTRHFKKFTGVTPSRYHPFPAIRRAL